jgi:O-antigen ligase
MSFATYSSAGFYKRLGTQALPPSLFVVAALMASIPLENLTVLPAIGSISRLVGALAAMAVLLDSMMALEFRSPHPAHAPLALFVIWSGWTCFWSVNPDLTAERLITNLQLLVLVWLIWQSVRDLRQLRILLEGYVLGSCGAVVFTIINSRNLVAIDLTRYAGAGADPNELGITLVLSLPMTYYLCTTARTWQSRVFWLFPIPLCLTGVVLTASRAGLIATMVAFLGVSLWQAASSSRMRYATLIACVLILIAGLATVPKANLTRYASIAGEVSSGSVGKRTIIWREGMELFQHRPLTGIGAATFGYASAPLLGKDLVAHNVYVSVLTETGIIGFLIFSLALSMFFIAAVHLGFAERSLWLTVMVIWCIGVMSLTWEYKKVTWSVFALLIATAGMPEQAGPRQANAVRASYRQEG